MDKKIIKERINALRATFGKEGIAAFIIPSTDAHMSEYVAPPLESERVDFGLHWFGRNRSRHLQ